LIELLTKAQESRKERVKWLYNLIEKNPGIAKKEALGILMVNLGVSRSVAYEYLGALIDAGSVVEDSEQLFTAEEWSRIQKERYRQELEIEERRTRLTTLEAFITTEE